jgi:hypothetical protein
MTNLAIKFRSAVSAGIVASATMAIFPLSALGAAECLTTPKDEARSGRHWYYRIERGTKRHCWYLREEGETSSKAATPARLAGPEAAPDGETKLTHSAADAHAEISRTTPAASVAPGGVEQKLSSDVPPETSQSMMASRWPEPTGVFSSATERAISPSLVVAAAAPDANANAVTDLTPKVPPVAPTKVETAVGTSASLQMLHLGMFGAIAVSSLTGSAIYLLGRMRRRSQRNASLNLLDWPAEEATYHAGIPPWLEPNTVSPTCDLDPGPDAGSQSVDRQRNDQGDNFREIERLLARFANQAVQAES